jgi:diacylglycerol kinase family enzyme
MANVQLGVVVNLNAAHHRRNGVATGLERALGGRGILEQSRNESDLLAIAERFKRAGVSVLAISGGDGTAGSTLTAFRTVWGAGALPVVALLRGGTMNTVANGVGVPRRPPERILDAFADAVGRGETTVHERATIDAAGRLGFLFGTGVFAAFLEEYYARGNGAPTVWTAVQTLSAIAASVAARGPLGRKVVAQERVELTVDGARWECPSPNGYTTIAAGTVAQAGLGFRPFRRADERSDAFHVLAVHSAPTATLRVLPRVHRGEQMPPGAARDALATEVRLKATDGPLRYMLDGELAKCEDTLVLRAGPPVRVLRPAAAAARAW